jgi:hypothetical protein
MTKSNFVLLTVAALIALSVLVILSLWLTREKSSQVPRTSSCHFTSAPTSVTWPADGGIGQFGLTASSPTCEWTALTSADWLLPRTTSYVGSGTEGYGVGRNETGARREATLKIGDSTFTVYQTATFGGKPVDGPAK